MEYFGVKVEDIFNTMEERFRPEGAEGVDASFGYDISGAGKWKLTIKDSTMMVETADDLSGCTVLVETDSETFVGINLGKIDGTQAYSAGKFKINGDVGLLGKTARMFRKYVAPRKELSLQEIIADIFGTLEDRFKPESVGEFEAVISYDITGKEGGQWTAAIKGGKCDLKEGIDDSPSLKFQAAAQDWADLMLGKAEAMSLLSSGKLALEGETAIAAKLQEVFGKYQLPGEEEEQELLVLKKVISVDQRFATGPVMGKFLKALKDKKILAIKCPKCGRLQVTPREVCAICRVRNTEWVEVGPSGELKLLEHTYYASPDPLTGETRETPYGMASILLDGCEGIDVFSHIIRPDQLDKVVVAYGDRKGSRLRPVWNEKRTGKFADLKYFEIDD